MQQISKLICRSRQLYHINKRIISSAMLYLLNLFLLFNKENQQNSSLVLTAFPEGAYKDES